VIELDVGRPGRLTVTSIAGTSLRAVVWIGVLVAGVAFGPERFFSETAAVASATADAHVCTPERETGVTIMIEADSRPTRGRVTSCAVRPVAAAVAIVDRVAVVARGAGYLGVEIVAVACFAPRGEMLTREHVLGVTRMIEVSTPAEKWSSRAA
jgi:hypothetical protein